MKISLLLDSGNTAIKLGLANENGVFRKVVIANENISREAGNILKSLAREAPEKIEKVVAATVVPDLKSDLAREVEAALGLPVKFAGHDIYVPVKNSYNPPETLGIDRLLGTFAASRMFSAQKTIIVVDLGTAITFDCICQNEYLGGLIFPGPGVAAKALADQAALLPLVKFEKTPSANMLGTNTQECIALGLFHGYVSLLQALCNKLRKEFPHEPFVIGTGGYTSLFENYCNAFDRIVPDLVINGLWLLAYNG